MVAPKFTAAIYTQQSLNEQHLMCHQCADFSLDDRCILQSGLCIACVDGHCVHSRRGRIRNTLPLCRLLSDASHQFDDDYAVDIYRRRVVYTLTRVIGLWEPV